MHACKHFAILRIIASLDKPQGRCKLRNQRYEHMVGLDEFATHSTGTGRGQLLALQLQACPTHIVVLRLTAEGTQHVSVLYTSYTHTGMCIVCIAPATQGALHTLIKASFYKLMMHQCGTL